MFDRARWLRLTPLAVALVAAVPLQACFGKFALVQTLYKINKDVSDSYIVQEIVFLLFAVLQVYTVVGFIDAFVLNPIEVITGDNPIDLSAMDVGDRQEIALKGGETLILTRTADGLRLEQITAKDHRTFVLRQGARGMELTDETDRILAQTIRLEDGTFQVVDRDGRVFAHPGRSMLAQMGEALGRGDTAVVAELATLETGPDACLLAY